MEEKKITDEEIAKAILQSIEYSKTITYFDEWGNCKAIMMADVIDLIHRLHSENAEQKAEIERLTKTLDVCCEQLYHSCMDKGELQKQVDELKEERENMQAEIIATEEARLQAVKSTAKEIFEKLLGYIGSQQQFCIVDEEHKTLIDCDKLFEFVGNLAKEKCVEVE